MKKKLIVLICLFFTIIISVFVIYSKIQKSKEAESAKRRYLMETERIIPNTETDVITIK